MPHKRTLLPLGLAGVLLFLVTRQIAQADAPTISHPAHNQVRAILPELRDTQAEHASGAYVPGVGAILTLELVRGPNSIKDLSPSTGTQDWAIQLMRTFGPRLNEVPPYETIALSIDFYDYAVVVYHQLVITCRAAEINHPSQYLIWLDGKPLENSAGHSVSVDLGS